MELNLSKEWFQKHAEEDDDLKITAGSLSFSHLPLPIGKSARAPQGLAFGRLISLSRRKRGWSIGELATSAQIDASEAIRIEHDPAYIPGPHAVRQLSDALNLPCNRMLQLSGNTLARDGRLEGRAVKFAAQSEFAEKLSRREHRALDQFVNYLNDSK